MKMQLNTKCLTWFVAAVATLFACNPASGDSGTWTGATDAAWLTDTNWLDNIVPGSTTETSNVDVATFSNNTQTTVALDMSLTEGVYYLGALQRLTGSSSNRVVRNGNGSAPGVLTLNGATLDTVAGGVGTTNVIIHQATTGGTVNITNGTGTGTLGINLPTAVSYKVVIDSLSNVIVTSNVTGLGGLTVLRAAGVNTQFQLLGNNSYSGDTIVDSARLRAGNGNGIPNGAGKGNVILQGTVSAPFTTPVQPLFGITANETINGLSGDGYVDNDGNTPFTLSIGDNDATSTFVGTVYNSGGAANTGYLSLAKIGNGTLTLSGNNTYSGTTSVNGGTLLVNGSHAGFHSNFNKQFFTDTYTVFNGATLGGIGNIDATVAVRGGGIVSPGSAAGISSLGTLTINQLTNSVLQGDYNGDDVVNAADFTLWRDTVGDTVNLVANGDNVGASMGVIDDADRAVWQGHFGSSNSGTGILAIDIDGTASSNDLLTVEGEIDLTTFSVDFNVTGALTQSSYVFASYVSRIGTFASANTPAGYTIDYNFGINQIALVQVVAGSQTSTAIPEPGSLLLLGLGVLSFATARIRCGPSAKK